MSIALLATAAHGQDETRASDARMVSYAQDMPGLAPGPGRDKAPVRVAPWCEGIENYGRIEPNMVVREYNSSQRNEPLALINAARQSCAFESTRIGQVASTMIEQTWINMTGLSDADAVESLKARLHEDRWKRDRKKLCDQLPEPGAEIVGEDREFARAHRGVLGCGNEGVGQWLQSGEGPDKQLAPFLEQSEAAPDEIVRLSRILDRASGHDFSSDHQIVMYAIDGYDFKALSPAKVMSVLETPPYQGNLYARVMLKESLATAQLKMAVVEAEVKKRIVDADWKELLITGPARGVESYQAAIAPYAAEIARSNAFEHKAMGPSKRAMAGCLAPLRADFLAVYRKLPHATVEQATQSLADPVASLLFGRLLVCMGADGEAAAGRYLVDEIGHDVPTARGPRTAAYYGMLAAFNKIKADRERFPVDKLDLPLAWSHTDLLRKLAPDEINRYERIHTGVVKSVQKVANGVQVTFAATKHQEMTSSCTPTSQIVQIRADGTIQYYQNCRNTGLVTVNDTPAPVAIPAAYAEGIRPGCAIELTATGDDGPKRHGFPRKVWADKTKKKLVAYFGFAL